VVELPFSPLDLSLTTLSRGKDVGIRRLAIVGDLKGCDGWLGGQYHVIRFDSGHILSVMTTTSERRNHG
jgi:hypothetical protein